MFFSTSYLINCGYEILMARKFLLALHDLPEFNTELDEVYAYLSIIRWSKWGGLFIEYFNSN